VLLLLWLHTFVNNLIPTVLPKRAGIKRCLLFWDRVMVLSCPVLVLPHPSICWDWCDSVWRVGFQQFHHPTYKAGIKVMCCFVITRVEYFKHCLIPQSHGLGLKCMPALCDYRVFQQSTQFPPIMQEIKVDVLLFVITCVRVFFNSPTHSHLWRDWVMCCSLWLHVLEYFFNSPT
jgi:hypothetical protein